MTIEERLEHIIHVRQSGGQWGLIEWKWNGKPFSLAVDNEWRWQETFEMIEKLIKKADNTECLTSNYEYVRECKKYFMENE